MDLDWLEDFAALAEHGNFSRAAEMRHVSQPAFSRRIKALEDWIGVPLFSRGAQGVTLTAAGEQFRFERRGDDPPRSSVAPGSARGRRQGRDHAALRRDTRVVLHLLPALDPPF